MKVLTKWLRSYLPELSVSDAQLAEDLTLRGIAVEGIYDLGEGNGSLYEMDITTNRVDAMNHYGIAREAAAIYGLELKPLDTSLPAAPPAAKAFPVRIEAEDACGRFTARVLRDVQIAESRDWFADTPVSTYFALLEQKKISNAVDATNFVVAGDGAADARVRSRQAGRRHHRATRAQGRAAEDARWRGTHARSRRSGGCRSREAGGACGRDGRLGHDDHRRDKECPGRGGVV